MYDRVRLGLEYLAMNCDANKNFKFIFLYKLETCKLPEEYLSMNSRQMIVDTHSLDNRCYAYTMTKSLSL